MFGALAQISGKDGPKGAVLMVEGAITHLPLTNTELFGREAELAWLDACWRDRAFVASIVAWGGVGKTSLVTKWLAGMRDADWCGAERIFDWSFYRQGTNTGSSDTFFAKALAEFGDPDPLQGSPWDKGERLAKLVRQKRTLLVLDGVEPMQYGPGEQEGQFKDPALQTLVKELASNNNGFLLITSRLRLRDLDGLSGSKVQSKTLEDLSAGAGAQLLRARGARGTAEELRSASDEYKGHALALTLLASYLEDVAESDIRRRNEIGPLIYDEREGGHARRVMEAYDPWLGQTERAILRMLGLFDRPATEDEIAALRADPVFLGLNDDLTGVPIRDWNRAVSKLRRIGLVASESGNAIDAHPLVRQHFGEKFKYDNLDAWREGHRRLYEFLQTIPKRQRPETIAEMEPLYKAVVHGCLAGRHDDALIQVWLKRIMRGDQQFSPNQLGMFGHEVEMFAAFFDVPWERIAPGVSARVHACVLGHGGYALRAVGRLDEATSLLTLSVAHDKASNDWTNAARSASNLSELLYARGQLNAAIETATKGVELADMSGERFERMGNRTTLAMVYHGLGLGDRAAALFIDAERIQLESSDAYPILVALPGYRYCDLLLDRSQVSEVRERATKALKWAKQLNVALPIALDYISLARCHLVDTQRGAGVDMAAASLFVQQAVDGLRRTNRQHHIPLGLFARAELHIYTGEFADARRDLDEAMTIATRCGFRLHECDAHLGYARLAIAERNRVDARERLEKARKIVEETGYHRRDRDLEQNQNELDKLPNEVKPVTHSNQPLVSPSPAMTHQTAVSQDSVDIGIIVALEEEFTEFAELAGALRQHRDEILTAYRFERGPYRLVATFAGDMGESHATRVTERIISLYHPHSVVVIGIAGGIHDDLRVGDVYVPAQAVQYMQDAKAAPSKENPSGFVLKPGAPAYRADFSMLEAVRHFAFGHANIHRQFVEESRRDLETLIPEESLRTRLFEQNLVRREVKRLADAHVATGPVVGAAPGFSAWIREHDRNIKALEMESAAVWSAAQARNTPVRALAIRGISDYGDERKAALDKIGGGALRKYAMRNAVRLLLALLDAEVLPRNPR